MSPDSTRDPEDLSLERAATLTAGASWWRTAAIPEAGIPALVMSDGPHGIRFQPQDDEADHLGLHDSVPATCFPPAVALGCTWNPELAARVGTALAAEAVQHGIGVVLGPGINIKRAPQGGRNFEYFSEDPFLTGELGAGWVQGLQSAGVGASLKHFAVNSQETRRMTMDARVDERTLREIYLRAFEKVVRRSRPWTVMCSYNRVNGEWASQSRELLTRILREEWGFDGAVISDWGAVVDRPRALAAGLDLEMPPAPHHTDAVLEAVRDGSLEEAVVRRAAARIARLARRAGRTDRAVPVDVDAAHALAREVAEQAIVLLRNDAHGDAPLLPLIPGQRIAVIGELARTPRYQGSGSSRVVPTRVDIPLDALRGHLGDAMAFAPGYPLAEVRGRYAVDAATTADESGQAQLRADAVAAAASADVVVLFLGLPAQAESEGYDRADIELPADQLALLQAVQAANDRIVVVLSHGGVVRIGSWAERIPALLDATLLGQAGGAAIADALVGTVNPSGRLAETVPLRLEDTPAFGSFGGGADEVVYGEGVFVGYRWYDARRLPVAFPFGHGLSYTTFAYADLDAAVDEDGITVSFTLRNTGAVGGREVAQVYLALPGPGQQPVRELKGFVSVRLEAGESRRVTVRIPRDELASWSVSAHAWQVRSGECGVEVGASSRDLRLKSVVSVRADAVDPLPTIDSTIGDWLVDERTGPRMREVIGQLAQAAGGAVPAPESPGWAMFADLRLAQITQLRPDLVSIERVRGIAAAVLAAAQATSTTASALGR